MAPLPQNNTARYILTYTNGTDNHELTVRYDDSIATAADAAQAANLLFTAVENRLFSNFAYVSARNAARLSNITLPAALPLTSPTPGGGTPTTTDRAVQHTVSGRSTLGRRVALAFIGAFPAVSQDWVISRGDTADTDALLDLLQGIGTPTLPTGTVIAIDGATVVWYDRLTTDYNDYWVRQIRP
jgi:hypothetical protein